MDERKLQSVISRRFMVHFLLQIAALGVGMVVLVFIAIFLISSRIWQSYEPLYQFFSFLRDNIFLVFAGTWLAGILAILLLQWRRIAKSILALTSAIEQLVAGGEITVELPEDLHEVQEMLVRVQYEHMRNERMAREAEQRKNDLVVYLAHDLKTPLTSVLGYLTLLRDEPDISDELRQKYLAIATGKAGRLEDLINEFFEITRFSLKGLVLEPTRLNLSRMVEQVADEFGPIFAEKQLGCRQKIQPEIELTADAGKLERVVDNLLRNAVSYSYPDTEVWVSLRAENGSAVLTVRNHGATIPPHKLGHIFEQFYRVDESRSGAQGGGSGLGLAIAKEIVELHQGHISVVSENETIEFQVLLPGALTAAAAMPLAEPAVQAMAGEESIR